METRTRPLFLFDGDCGVCQKGTDTIKSKAKPRVDFAPYQRVDLDAHGVTEAEVGEGPVLVRTDGSHVVGPLAMAEVFTTSAGGFRVMGQIMLAPGMRNILSAVGPVMYRNRGKLPGANDACQVN